ncbi:TX51A-like protein [Mya arenaria]|uniref:TX51A-like protein n=1 Tax=Mya arenaria TaxID=6604 RepID=A0ABY7DIQ6_MYAAR|nr:U-scoloptoxin(05)-Sm1a-like [Mya arenaria]WAQ97522.1 TX51A-like protein [Mya arenaria]
MDNTLSLVPILVLLLMTNEVLSLKCYQCNSTLDHNCQEYFNHNNPYSPLEAEECTMYDAKYCIKVTGLWGGIVGTHRFCSARDLGDQCQDMRFPDHSRKYRGCIYTCGADGCNGAPASLASLTTLAYTIVSSFLVLALRR